MLKVAVATGGTGGHIFPAMALEEELKKNRLVKEVNLFAAATPLSGWILENRKGDIVHIPSTGFIGKKFHSKISAIVYALKGMVKFFIILRKELPDVACGFGNWGTIPFFLVCYMYRIPFILHEQNLIPGRTTRFLSIFSRKILVSFPDSRKFLPYRKTFLTGNICRREFVDYHMSLRGRYSAWIKKHILVVGGSQGSHFLNTNLPGALLKILEDFPPLSLVHISGKRDMEMVRYMYRQEGLRVMVIDFTQDMLEFLKKSFLVVSRAGATILSEICLCGTPPILIPFAESSDSHQYYNALWFRKRGAALVIEEKNFTEEAFYNMVRDLLRSPSQLEEMSERLLELAHPDAARLAVEEILKCSNQG